MEIPDKAILHEVSSENIAESANYFSSPISSTANDLRGVLSATILSNHISRGPNAVRDLFRVTQFSTTAGLPIPQ